MNTMNCLSEKDCEKIEKKRNIKAFAITLGVRCPHSFFFLQLCLTYARVHVCACV